jgi:hypothetical protein
MNKRTARLIDRPVWPFGVRRVRLPIGFVRAVKVRTRLALPAMRCHFSLQTEMRSARKDCALAAPSQPII